MKKVVTYQSAASPPMIPSKISICPDCEAELEASGEWPRNRRGEPISQVSHGLHDGICGVCEEIPEEE